LASREQGQGQALSWGRSLPSPARTLVTPYCKRTRPGRGTNTKAAGSPSLSLSRPGFGHRPRSSPLRARPRARPIWAGARDTLTRRLGDPPVSKRRHCSTAKDRQHQVINSVQRFQHRRFVSFPLISSQWWDHIGLLGLLDPTLGCLAHKYSCQSTPCSITVLLLCSADSFLLAA
jgi:hypothetical protein